jgi:hypothetical protein
MGFPDMYGRMMGKRFDADFFLDSAAEDGTHACDYLLACDMEMVPIPGFDYANWERGFGDFHMVGRNNNNPPDEISALYSAVSANSHSCLLSL